MLSFLNKYGYNVHSQNNEDGVIGEACSRLGLQSGYAIEAGGNDGLWLSNARHLIEQGWSGLFIEADYNLYLKCKENWKDNPRVRSQCCYVDERNINAFVDARCDLLSLDTDGSDFQIFRGLRVRPKIVIMEIDSSLPPDKPLFNSDGAAGYYKGVELALGRGYFLLAHTGNLVLVADEYVNLFNEVWGTHPLKDSDLYFNPAWLSEQDRFSHESHGKVIAAFRSVPGMERA